MENVDKSIGDRVRNLRHERRLPQRHLAKALGVSQATISRIEAGKEAVSVRQLLAICRLFNVLPTSFLPEEGSAQTQLRRSLVRHGAKNLLDDERTLPSARFANIKEAIRETLIAAESPRDIAALAPVIVKNVGTLPFSDISSGLFHLGEHLQRRFCWLLDNVVEALELELKSPALAHLQKIRLLRAKTRITAEFNGVKRPWKSVYGEPINFKEDVLDLDLNTPQSIDEARSESSSVSKRWKIVSRLQPEDFAASLHEALH